MLGIGSRIKHPAYGDGVVIRLHKGSYEVCFIQFGIKFLPKDYDNWEIREAVAAEEAVTFTEAEKSLVKILQAWAGTALDITPLGDKWKNGTLLMKPGFDGVQSKEVPIDTFFHKIVMMRDRLRVLEQQINASKNLSDEEKVNLQQYITRCYGSMTTFNVLFADKKDYFVGESGKD